MNSFPGMLVMPVPAGTVITDERTGEKATVTEETIVVARDGSRAWCTQKMFDRLKGAIDAERE